MRAAIAWGLVASVVLAGCGLDRTAGNTVETENTVGARLLSVDSLVPEWNHPEPGGTVATLRLDATNFDFSRTTATGEDLRLERTDGTSLAFEIRVWDPPARIGRIRLRLDDSLLSGGMSVVLRWGEPRRFLSDPASTWSGLSEALRLELGSVLVDDFEDTNVVNRLPDASSWYSAATESCTVSKIVADSAGRGRTGRAGAVTYATPTAAGYVLFATRLGPGPRSLRTLDSLVFWMRGSGTVGIAFDHLTNGTGPKAWKHMKIDSAWTRVRIRPEDLDPPGTVGGNVGWIGVRDSVTNLTFILTNGASFALDDVRLYGVDRDDLR